MVTKQTAIRFTPDDTALLDALQRKLGVVSRTEIVRIALRRLAEQEGVTLEANPPKPQ